mgnify:CR=1 FL=1
MASRPCQIPTGLRGCGVAGLRGVGWLRIGDQGVGMSESGDVAGPGTRHRVGRVTAIEVSGCGGVIACAGLANCHAPILTPVSAPASVSVSVSAPVPASASTAASVSVSASTSTSTSTSAAASCSASASTTVTGGHGMRAVWRFGSGRGVRGRWGWGADLVIRSGRGDRRGTGRQAVSWLRPYLAGRRWWCWRPRGRGAQAGPR